MKKGILVMMVMVVVALQACAQSTYNLSNRIKLNSGDLTSSPNFGLNDVGTYRTVLLDNAVLTYPYDCDAVGYNSCWLNPIGGYRNQSNFNEHSVLFNDFGTVYKPILNDVDLNYFLDKGLPILLDKHMIEDTVYDKMIEFLSNPSITPQSKWAELHKAKNKAILKLLIGTKYTVTEDTFVSTTNIRKSFDVEVSFEADSILKALMPGTTINASVSAQISRGVTKGLTVDGRYILAKYTPYYMNNLVNKVSGISKSTIRNSSNNFEKNLLRYDSLPTNSNYAINTGATAIYIQVAYDKTKNDTASINAAFNAILPRPSVANIATIKAQLEAHFERYASTTSSSRYNKVFMLRLGTAQEMDDEIKLKP